MICVSVIVRMGRRWTGSAARIATTVFALGIAISAVSLLASEIPNPGYILTMTLLASLAMIGDAYFGERVCTQ